MHTIIHPTIDRATDGTFTDNAVPLHKVGETEDAIIVRGARILATLAPFSDELAVYPAFPLPGEAPDSYALSFPVGMDAQIGRAHVRTPVTNAQLVCRPPLQKKK